MKGLKSFKTVNYDGKKVELYKFLEVEGGQYQIAKISKDCYSVCFVNLGETSPKEANITEFNTKPKRVGGATAKDQAYYYLEKMINGETA